MNLNILQLNDLELVLKKSWLFIIISEKIPKTIF
jgi:hypothetical protein